MSIIKKAPFLVGALIGLCFAATPTPNLNSALILDDFQDLYGDAAHQTTLSAVKNLSQNKNATAAAFAAYWYSYLDGVFLIDGLSTKDTIGVNEGDMVNINDGGIMHFSFVIDPNTTKQYPSGEVSCNLYSLETDSLDLSKMSALSFKAKGTGKIWIGIKSEKIKHLNGDWGTMGDTVVLKTAWTNVSILVGGFYPIPFSGAATAKPPLTWADCRTSCFGLQIKTWNSKSSEVYIDSIAFTGMVYSDVMTMASGAKRSFNVQASHSSSSISVNNAVVSYTVNERQDVSVSLFNADGKEMSGLFAGNASVGTHSVALPKSIIPGTYFVRLNSAHGIISHKFTLVK
jgi:hypothetical protein